MQLPVGGPTNAGNLSLACGNWGKVIFDKHTCVFLLKRQIQKKLFAVFSTSLFFSIKLHS